MTVRELIEELKKFDMDATVAVKYRDDGGDYWGCDYDIAVGVNDYINIVDKSVEKGVVLLYEETITVWGLV